MINNFCQMKVNVCQFSLICSPSLLSRSGAVLAGCDSQLAAEGPAQRLNAGKAAFEGDALQRQGGVFEQAASSVDAQQVNELRRGLPGVLDEGASEIALTHSGSAGEFRDGQVGAQVVANPPLHLDNGFAGV